MPPFLGYWINLIPSQSSFDRVLITRANREQSAYVLNGNLEKIASNEDMMTLETNDEMWWMMPHHGVYVTAVSFTYTLETKKGMHVHVYSSVDGYNWELLFDSDMVDKNVTSKVPCRSTSCASWF